MSRPQPLSLRLVRLAAGIAVALPAVSLYGAAGAWADRPAPSSSVAADKHGSDQAKGGDNEHGHDAVSGPHASDGAAGGSAGSVSATSAVAVADTSHDNGKGNDGKGNDGEHGNGKKDSGSTAATTSAAVTSPATGSSDHSKGNASTVGSVKSPQPLSNADKNPGGANNGGNCGSYCSTRDGSPSMNGNGGGEAKGKPCAGCVGKADNKNPPGQYKDGSDHNAGYECDRNHGIGRSNPAHTGCSPRPTPSSSPTCAPKDSCHHEDCDSDKHGNGDKGKGDDKGKGKDKDDDGKPCPSPSPSHSPSASPSPTCTLTGGCGGSSTTGTTTGNTTGTTTGNTTGTTTGNGTGGGSGGATTGLGGGSTGGAQGTTGGVKPPTCPSITAGGMTGPVRAGCPTGGGSGGPAAGGALPFTGSDLSVLIGIASLAGGLGLALTTAGNLRRRPQA